MPAKKTTDTRSMCGAGTGKEEAVEGIRRVPVADARSRVSKGEALLVCAYEDDSKYRSMRLEGAISARDLRAMAPSLDRDREIIFYCA